jgi:hypothetical protein
MQPYILNYLKRKFLSQKDYFSITNSRKKVPHNIFRDIWIFSAVLQNSTTSHEALDDVLLNLDWETNCYPTDNLPEFRHVLAEFDGLVKANSHMPSHPHAVPMPCHAMPR